jgi:DNA-directed RNA polymerase specialized sigma24 family protein
VAQDTPPSQTTKTPDDHTETASAGDQERFSQLQLCKSELSADEAILLHEYFPRIRAAHHKLVWDLLRRARLATHDIEEHHQEIFFTLHKRILKRGFPDSIPATLTHLTKLKLSNHLRAKKRAPTSTCLPSSKSEKPRKPSAPHPGDSFAVALAPPAEQPFSSEPSGRRHERTARRRARSLLAEEERRAAALLDRAGRVEVLAFGHGLVIDDAEAVKGPRRAGVALRLEFGPRAHRLARAALIAYAGALRAAAGADLTGRKCVVERRALGRRVTRLEIAHVLGEAGDQGGELVRALAGGIVRCNALLLASLLAAANWLQRVADDAAVLLQVARPDPGPA